MLFTRRSLKRQQEVELSKGTERRGQSGHTNISKVSLKRIRARYHSIKAATQYLCINLFRLEAPAIHGSDRKSSPGSNFVDSELHSFNYHPPLNLMDLLLKGV